MLQGMFQPLHLLVIAVVAVLVFGSKSPPKWPKGGGAPKHPLPSTSPVETSHGVKVDPPEDKPQYL